jgi:hypothetical protein
VFTRALHWSLSWARSIQSIPSHPISLRSILIIIFRKYFYMTLFCIVVIDMLEAIHFRVDIRFWLYVKKEKYAMIMWSAGMWQLFSRYQLFIGICDFHLQGKRVSSTGNGGS